MGNKKAVQICIDIPYIAFRHVYSKDVSMIDWFQCDGCMTQYIQLQTKCYFTGYSYFYLHEFLCNNCGYYDWLSNRVLEYCGNLYCNE